MPKGCSWRVLGVCLLHKQQTPSCPSHPALQVWQFIVEREIESSERFRAIQSYRAAMAVLQQQMHYVEKMRDSGMLDEIEEAQMMK